MVEQMKKNRVFKQLLSLGNYAINTTILLMLVSNIHILVNAWVDEACNGSNSLFEYHKKEKLRPTNFLSLTFI